MGRGVPLAAVTVLLAILGRFVLLSHSLLLLGWFVALAVFDVILAVSFALLLRLHREALERPIAQRLEVSGTGVRLVPGPASGRGPVEVPLTPGRVFVSPPGLNQPRREPDGGIRPRAYVRLEPEVGAPFAAPVPDDAARAVHREMSRRAAFGLGYDRGRNPLTRAWVRYEEDGTPGTATGVLANLPEEQVWSPPQNGYLALHGGGKQINV